MGSLVSEGETQIRYFQNNNPKLVLKNYTKDLKPSFPHSVRTSCSNFKTYEDKPKRPLVAFVSMTLICPIS